MISLLNMFNAYLIASKRQKKKKKKGKKRKTEKNPTDPARDTNWQLLLRKSQV